MSDSITDIKQGYMHRMGLDSEQPKEYQIIEVINEGLRAGYASFPQFSWNSPYEQYCYYSAMEDILSEKKVSDVAKKHGLTKTLDLSKDRVSYAKLLQGATLHNEKIAEKSLDGILWRDDYKTMMLMVASSVSCLSDSLACRFMFIDDKDINLEFAKNRNLPDRYLQHLINEGDPLCYPLLLEYHKTDEVVDKLLPKINQEFDKVDIESVICSIAPYCYDWDRISPEYFGSLSESLKTFYDKCSQSPELSLNFEINLHTIAHAIDGIEQELDGHGLEIE